jgi:DNA invertase Pin-like site-specific DNA recombinase
MARVGYSRVSTGNQHDEGQLDKLRAAGVDRIFTDHGVSGTKAHRPQWDECRGYLRSGDTLVVTKLDRVGRSVRHLVELANELHDRGVDLVVLDQAIDTTTPAGRFMFHILCAVAEMEHELTVERTHDGLAAARARGRKGGRKSKLTAAQERTLRAMYDSRQHTVREIADTFGISEMTVYRHLEERP